MSEPQDGAYYQIAYYQMTVRKNGRTVILTFVSFDVMYETRRVLRAADFEIVTFSRQGYVTHESVESAVKAAELACQ